VEKRTAEFNEALQLALKELAKGDRFAEEVRGVLERREFAMDVANEVLEHLTRKGLLNEKRATEAVLRRYSGKRAVGPEKIKQMLARRGAPMETAEVLLTERSGAQVDEIVGLLKIKFPAGATADRAGRFLYSRGFSEEAIASALTIWPEHSP